MIPQPRHNLHDVTLSEWIDYQNKYGQDLDDRLAELVKMPPGEDKDNTRLLYDYDYAICQYCLYSGLSLEEVNKLDSKEVIKTMGATFIAHKKQQHESDYHGTYEWRGEQWQIQPMFISKTPKMTAEELDKCQDLALIISDLQDGKHEALYCLCAMYFRKVGEPYVVDMSAYDHPRVKLMESLPMIHALRVKTYNYYTWNLYAKLSKV